MAYFPQKELLKAMRKEIKKLEKSHSEESKKIASEALIRTGVLEKDGTPKQQIVTESHLILSKGQKKRL